MSTSSYPHEFDDCDGCGRFDADMLVELDADEDVLWWCCRCAGLLLKSLTGAGMTAVVRPLVRARVVEPADEPASAAYNPGWTVDLAVEALKRVSPEAVELVRALVEEGGRATSARLKELVGVASFASVSRSLNSAARHVWRAGRPAARPVVAAPVRDPARPSQDIVYSYVLPEGSLEVWRTALVRLNR